jgi:hypothetical protein
MPLAVTAFKRFVVDTKTQRSIRFGHQHWCALRSAGPRRGTSPNHTACEHVYHLLRNDSVLQSKNSPTHSLPHHLPCCRSRNPQTRPKCRPKQRCTSLCANPFRPVHILPKKSDVPPPPSLHLPSSPHLNSSQLAASTSDPLSDQLLGLKSNRPALRPAAGSHMKQTRWPTSCCAPRQTDSLSNICYASRQIHSLSDKLLGPT